MWDSTPHQWLLNMAFLVVIGVICVIVARFRLWPDRPAPSEVEE